MPELRFQGTRRPALRPLAGLLLLVAAWAFLPGGLGAAEAERASHKVTRVIDADTIEVKIEWADYAQVERVRLIGWRCVTITGGSRKLSTSAA